MSEDETETRLYRGLLIFVGAIYLVWWLAVRAILPDAYNPLFGRLLVAAFIWGGAVGSYLNDWIRQHIRLWWMAGLWLLTTHYFYLFYENHGDINWVVGAFITVSAITLGLMSRASLTSYSIFTVGLSVGLVILIPALRQSVFLPGLVTVLLQANIGLQSRLKIIRTLALSNERFQRLFNTTFEGIMIHEGGRVVQVNEALLGMLGSAPDDLLGRDVLDFVHPDDRAGLRDKMRSETIAPYETRGMRKDGTALDIEIRGKPFTSGEPSSLLMTVEDISERKKQAAAVQQASEALARSNIELQRFASVASHDLQTPLRSIASFVGLLGSTYQEKLDAQGRDWLRRTSESVEQLQRLIQDLLDYSRVDAQTRPFESVSVPEVLDRAKVLLDAAIRESKAEITSGDLPSVMGDPSQLTQLVMNLLDNAIKYRGSEAPRIHVAAKLDGDEWTFEVQDNGIGIAPQHQQRVFEIFKRLHDAKEYPGTGIGLAVCRRVVNRHGGKIWVTSELGSGSVFHFTLAKAESLITDERQPRGR